MSNVSVSANALLHFTDSRKKLLNILENEFCPRYSAEDIPTLNSEGEKPHFYCPMVCFSDIPLSRINDHVDFYGEYAIGLSKEWGKRNGLNPVFYLHAQSLPSKILGNIVQKINEAKSKSPTESQPKIFRTINQEMLELNLYTKRHQGRPWRKGKRLTESRTFYDEREWRYVPSLQARFLKVPVTYKSDKYDKEVISSFEEKLEKYAKLNFEPSDIKYLIVRNEKDILPLIRELERIKVKYSPDVIKKLSTRIMTIQQIRNDF